MKFHGKIQEFLMDGVCISTPLKDAVRMVAVMNVIFAFGFMLHGSYLYASTNTNHKIFGVLYVISGIVFWTLTWMLWMTSEKPSYFRCRMWIWASVLNQLLVAVLTVTRNAVEGTTALKSANIWIACGLFLQIYMTGVVWSFMVNFMRNETKNYQANADHPHLDHSNVVGNAEDSTVSTDDGSLIDKNSTVVSL